MDWDLSSPPPKILYDKVCRRSHFFFAWAGVRLDDEEQKQLKLMNILKRSLSAAALDGYEATLFDCQDNKQFFCSRNMCEKHQFIVKC